MSACSLLPQRQDGLSACRPRQRPLQAAVSASPGRSTGRLNTAFRSSPPTSRRTCRVLAVAAASDELQATATAAAAAAAGDGLNASVAPGVRGEAAASGDPGVDPGAALRKGTLFGAVSLIVGNTVGAGMLALPAVSAPAGLGPTSAGLVVMWGLLALDALLIAEVNLAARAARDAGGAQQGGGARQAAPAGGSIVTLRQMAEFSLGQAGKGLTLVYLGLAYSLLTAYATKAAEVIDYLAGGGLPPVLPAAAFVGGMGALLYAGGTRTIDSVNQGLTSVLLCMFCVILAAGVAQHSDLPAALLAGPADWGALQPAVPIMFLALVYHDLVPVIVNYLGGDRARIRTALVLGSLVPLAMFLSWEAVALSLLPSGLADGSAADGVLQASLALGGADAAGAASSTAAATVSTTAAAAAPAAAAAVDGPGAALALDPLDVFVRRSPPLVGRLVEAFSFLAVGTSFIGTTLSLSETLRTEVPPLLAEAGKQLRRASGAEVSADLSDDELSCLLASGPSNGAGCSVACDQQAGAQPAAAESAAMHGAAAADGSGQRGGWGGDQRALALALTLCPPLALAVSNPDNFLGALEFAGAYGMTTLYGLLPPVMAWQLRQKMRARAPEQQQQQQQAQQQQAQPAAAQPAAAQRHQRQPRWRQQPHEEMVPGGAPVLAGMFSAAVVIGASRLAADVGLTSGGGPDTPVGMAASLVEAALRNPGALPQAMLALVQGSGPLAVLALLQGTPVL